MNKLKEKLKLKIRPIAIIAVLMVVYNFAFRMVVLEPDNIYIKFKGEKVVYDFMEQAEDYMAMTKESKWSKALEFMMYSQIDHPLNAVRAYEANKWQQSPEFAQILSCLQQNENAEKTTGTKSGASAKVSMQRGAEEFRGDNVNCVRMELQFMGFTNFKMNRIVGKFSRHQDNDVVEVTVNGASFQQGDWFPSDAQIEITYYDSIDS